MNQAHFVLYGIARKNESEKRIGVSVHPPPPDCYENKGDVLLSNPVSLQIDLNAQSDCRDGTNNRLVIKSRVHPIPPPFVPSGITYEGWDVKGIFSYLSSPPSVPSLFLFNLSRLITALQKFYKNAKRSMLQIVNNSTKKRLLQIVNSNTKKECNGLLHFFAIYYIRIPIS